MSSFRLGIKVCVLMIPFLGITWLFGLLSPLHKAFAYIFTILNSTQVCCKFPLALLIKVRDLNTLNKRNNSIYQSINVAIRPSIFSQSFRLPIYQSFLQPFCRLANQSLVNPSTICFSPFINLQVIFC